MSAMKAHRFGEPIGSKILGFVVYVALGVLGGAAAGAFIGGVVCALIALMTGRGRPSAPIYLWTSFLLPGAVAALLVLAFAMREWHRRYGTVVAVDAQGLALGGRVYAWSEIEDVDWSTRIVGTGHIEVPYTELVLKLAGGKTKTVNLFTLDPDPLRRAIDAFRSSSRTA